jgi:hypothetical protein
MESAHIRFAKYRANLRPFYEFEDPIVKTHRLGLKTVHSKVTINRNLFKRARNKLARLYYILKITLNEAAKTHGQGYSHVRFVLDSSSSSAENASDRVFEPLNFPYMRIDQLTPARIFERLELYSQSKKELLLNNQLNFYFIFSRSNRVDRLLH